MTESEKIKHETEVIKVWLPLFKTRVAFENLAITFLLLKLQTNKVKYDIKQFHQAWNIFQHQLGLRSLIASKHEKFTG